VHVNSLFRAALMADMLGDDEAAIEYYERCLEIKPVRINVLINLAVLYEERGLLRKAETNLRHVLNEYPTHVRAQHFIDSVESSYSMVVDERTQRERDHRNAVLDVPISEFELSVRSRNCLRQMNIRTLGDLLRVSETELLAYKNFGDTSLNEIKVMLTQKGLKLGQSAPRPAAEPAPRQATAYPPLAGDLSLHLSKPVSELELSVRSRKCIQRLGISTLGELAIRSEAELMSIKNFGQTSLVEIKKQLALYGLSLRQSR
jgi:DNA-directed RNA polymerase subunit alpha